MAKLKALASGAIGAVALNLLHETARQLIPHAPRMEVIGMRALARSMRAAGEEPPPRDALYYLTLLGDLVSNGLYYSLVGTGKNVWLRGGLLGLLAGIGGALLPPPLGLGRPPGERVPHTQLMTIAWYLVGGLVAAAASRLLASPGEEL